MSRRTRLGTWTCPSGNSCDVFIVPGTEVPELALEWDRFPLSDGDKAYYLVVLLPAITRRVKEYLELVGPHLTVLG